MGISGLLQFIREASEPINVVKYRGLTLAVDTYCWLHKGAFSCAEKLAKGEATDQYVWYCMKFVDMLLGVDVRPILVFDGRNLPSKQEVEKSRRERREANLRRGRQLLREGKVCEARECFTRCVNITPAMAHNLIKVARARGVDCIVAPYEADAQLAYLSRSGLAQGVITEDSDLLAFGCKKVILKMDKHGNGLEIDQDNFGRCRSLGNVFTEEKFRYMCILSGCDYLPSLPGIGLGKACKLLRLASEPDILKVIRKMGHYLKMNLTVPDHYVEGFVRANNTFLYQLVFDPVRRKVVPLNPHPQHLDVSTLSYAGLHLGDDRDLQMAVGNLDLNTLERIDDFDPDTQTSAASSRCWNNTASPGGSIWSKDFKAAGPSEPKLPPSPPSEEPRGASRRTPCRELQVKRPREDVHMSDDDLVQQYLTSNQKRPRSNPLPDSAASNRKPRPCGVFATHLQRRNGEATDEWRETRSRFFSHPGPAVKRHPEPSGASSASSGSAHIQSVNLSAALLNAPSSSTPAQSSSSPPQSSSSPPQSSSSSPQSSSSPPLASQNLQLPANPTSQEASESSRSTLGLAALQNFKYLKTFSCHTKTQHSPLAPHHSDSSARLHKDFHEDLHDSPPSPDDQTSHSKPSSDHFPPPPHQSPVSELIACGRPEQQWSSPHAAKAGRTLEITKSKALDQSGGSRQQQQQQQVKIRPAGGVRVSGLRRRSAPKEKLSSNDDENKPRLQATISSLWKNFAFQLERQKM